MADVQLFLQVDDSEGGMPSNTVDNAILDKGGVLDEASPGLFFAFFLTPVEYITFPVGSRSLPSIVSVAGSTILCTSTSALSSPSDRHAS